MKGVKKGKQKNEKYYLGELKRQSQIHEKRIKLLENNADSEIKQIEAIYKKKEKFLQTKTDHLFGLQDQWHRQFEKLRLYITDVKIIEKRIIKNSDEVLRRTAEMKTENLKLNGINKELAGLQQKVVNIR